jgi:P4 family phage/plasmid primase-like protien
MGDDNREKMHPDLRSFLVSHKCEGDNKPTHTRIGDKGSIRGGKYYIPVEEEPEFLEHYYNEIVKKNGSEYLTEKQLGEGGAVAVDLDFRYDNDIRVRQHNEHDIVDLISIYLEILKTIFIFVADMVDFHIYIFEKPSVNLSNEDVTKDGIHMIIGIKMSSVLQLYLREKVLKVFETNPNDIDFINDLPLKDTCTWNTVLDEGISKGCVNWQLYGSKKPANQAYKLTGVYHITMDDADNEFCSSSIDVREYENSFENFCKLSIRYRDHPEYNLQPGMEGVLQERSGKNKQMKKGGRVLRSVPSGNLKVISRSTSSSNVVDPTSLVPMENIQTKEELDSWCTYLETTLQDSSRDYKISEIHEYAKILPERFYGPGSYNEWIRLGFALKNTSEMLFVTWMVVSSKDPSFDYSRIPEFYTTWARIDRKTDGNVLTSKSIIYWAKEYNYDEYMTVKRKTLSYFVNISIENPDDREVAQVLYNLASERFVCATLTNTTHTWYEFQGHRWFLDKGLRIRKSGISEDLYEVYYNEHVAMMLAIQSQASSDSLEDPEYKGLIRKNKTITEIMSKCHNNVQKNHIAKEAAELLWDRDFGEKLDQDKYTLGFENGVVDLRTGEFRDGRPLDYISKSTLIDYYDDARMKTKENLQIKVEINEFMTQLFPDDELKEYVWEHLASTLIGENASQTFNIYKGDGSNGKSLLTVLMSICFGEYCNPTAPIGVITSKRQSVGGTSSELYALKSIRYAVFQEPTKDMVLNEGAMKEMTGDAKIQARELYQTSTTFNQMFTLAVCTNTFFQIKTQDEGTWRRLRIVEFKSCFKNPDVYDKLPEKQRNNKYIYKKDPTLKEKLPIWAPVFMRMLIDRCVINQGIVKDCDMVLEETNKYRFKQDLIGQFIQEMIIEVEGSTLSKQEVSQQWKQWCETNQATNVPKVSELTDHMNSHYEKNGRNGWSNVTFSTYIDAEQEL